MHDEPILKYKARITADAEKMTIVENTARGKDFCEQIPCDSLFQTVNDYEGFLDVLAMEADRTLCNSRNLYDRYEGNGFFSQDRWFSQADKYVFKFGDNATSQLQFKYPQRAIDDIEKNRDMFFDIFMGKYRSENSYSHRQYKKWVTNM